MEKQMRFRLFFLGTELFDLTFAWPAKGIYPVPDEIPSEWETFDLEEEFFEALEAEEEDEE